MRRASDALVNQSGEEGRGDDELTPLGVERRWGLSGNRLIERAALLLELRDLVADRDRHVPISHELRLVGPCAVVFRKIGTTLTTLAINRESASVPANLPLGGIADDGQCMLGWRRPVWDYKPFVGN